MEALYVLLERLGYTHPVHAPVTHIPIGLTVGAFAFTLLARPGRSALLTSARHCTALAFIATFPTAVLGYADWQRYFAGVWLPQIERKMVLAALLTVSLAATWIALRGERPLRFIAILLVTLNVLLVGGLGYWGGALVFNSLTPPSRVDSLTIQKGGDLYRQLCASCHPGGGNALKASLPLRTAPQLENLDAFIGYLRSPKARDGSTTVMPPFGEERLSGEQATSLYHYVKRELAAAGN